MDYTHIMRKLSICGLDCGRCADYEDGEIKALSAKLFNLLKGYERLAEIKSNLNHIFKDYNKFRKILEIFADSSCGGCRSENVKCPIDCYAQICQKVKKVDFCFQCPEFPCDKQFGGRMRERWIERNNRMKKMGVVEFYLDQSKLSRY